MEYRLDASPVLFLHTHCLLLYSQTCSTCTCFTDASVAQRSPSYGRQLTEGACLVVYQDLWCIHEHFGQLIRHRESMSQMLPFFHVGALRFTTSASWHCRMDLALSPSTRSLASAPTLCTSGRYLRRRGVESAMSALLVDCVPCCGLPVGLMGDVCREEG